MKVVPSPLATGAPGRPERIAHRALPRRALAPIVTAASLLLCFLLLTAPVCAGHWNVTRTATGTIRTQNPDTGEVTTQSWSNSTGGFAGAYAWTGDHNPQNIFTNGTITATFTWVPDGDNDPAPPRLKLNESASAYWDVTDHTGSLVYGPAGAFGGGCSVSIGGAVVGSGDEAFRGWIAKHDIVEVNSSSGTVTRTCTINASASGNGMELPPIILDDGTPYSPPWEARLGAAGQYFVSIHAHPYNFRMAPDVPGGAERDRNPRNLFYGRMRFKYLWSSTTGDVAHLTNIKFDETVTYDGNVGDYTTDSFGQRFYEPPQPIPFTLWKYRTPTQGRTVKDQYGNPAPNLTNGEWGALVDDHLNGGPWPYFWIPADRMEWTFQATQIYEYHCDDPRCMAPDEWKPIDDGPAAKEYTITRTLKPLGYDGNALCWYTNGHWEWTTEKDGFTAYYTFTRLGNIAEGIRGRWW